MKPAPDPDVGLPTVRVKRTVMKTTPLHSQVSYGVGIPYHPDFEEIKVLKAGSRRIVARD